MHGEDSPQSGYGLHSSAMAEEQRVLNEQLTRRLAALEAENGRLRTRNLQLEALTQHQQQAQQPRRITSPPTGRCMGVGVGVVGCELVGVVKYVVVGGCQ